MAILFHEDINIFELKTNNTSYIIGVNEEGGIQSLHWGAEVDARECVQLLKTRFHSSFDPKIEKEREECSPWGGLFYGEPSIKVTFADGVRDMKMSYSGYSIKMEGGNTELVIKLKDLHYGLEMELIYRVMEEFDLIERWCRVINTGEEPIALESACSAVWNLPQAKQYRLTHVAGRWAGEGQLRCCDITEGKKILESRRGFTGTSSNPWFAIDNGFAGQEYGDVWFGALAWSGNWKITVEKTSFNNLRVVGGINDFDFMWDLRPGEIFETPAFTGGYCNGGYGAMSRNLHGYERAFVMPGENAGKPRKVLYNSWEATGFDVNIQNQMELAEKAAKLGIELFVVDDGWFGTRNSDKSGLGDWHVNRTKFPHGLAPLIDKVNELGMDFGIWVEPEMVNPDSLLFAAHPDWVYGFPTRTGSLGRNQLVLNLSKEEIKAYIMDFMTELLGSNNISFIKWDMNRPFSEPGWMEMPQSQQKEIWVRHIRNLYSIWSTLRDRFPQVTFECCAGGGGRIDLGIMRYADQFWVSDNTDAFDRLSIQEGYSYVYCSKAMMCWVTNSPNYMNGRKLSMKYRFLSSMMGSLGIGGNLNEWTEEELDEARQMVSTYREIRHIVQDGRLYRLNSPSTGVTAVQYADIGMMESVVFILTQSRQFGEGHIRIRLKGLEPDRLYHVGQDDGETFRMSGRGLMNIGLSIQMKGDFDSRLIRIRAVMDEG